MLLLLLSLLLLLATRARALSVGMVKQPTAEQTEFQMSSEDFPALPGTQLSDGILTSAASQGMTINHNAGRFFRIFDSIQFSVALCFAYIVHLIHCASCFLFSFSFFVCVCGSARRLYHTVNHGLGGNVATVGGGDGINSGIDFGNGATRDLDKSHHHLADLQLDSSQDKAFKRGIQTSPDGE